MDEKAKFKRAQITAEHCTGLGEQRLELDWKEREKRLRIDTEGRYQSSNKCIKMHEQCQRRACRYVHNIDCSNSSFAGAAAN